MREEVTGVWELALERSPPTPDDLNRIPFTLLSFRIVQPPLWNTSAASPTSPGKPPRAITKFMGNTLPIDHDVVITGAILADVRIVSSLAVPFWMFRHSATGFR